MVRTLAKKVSIRPLWVDMEKTYVSWIQNDQGQAFTKLTSPYVRYNGDTIFLSIQCIIPYEGLWNDQKNYSHFVDSGWRNRFLFQFMGHWRRCRNSTDDFRDYRHFVWYWLFDHSFQIAWDISFLFHKLNWQQIIHGLRLFTERNECMTNKGLQINPMRPVFIIIEKMEYSKIYCICCCFKDGTRSMDL